MKKLISTITRLVPFFALAVWCLPVRASAPVDVQWKDVCKAAGDERLIITTSNGESVAGHCISVTVTYISVDIGQHQIVRLARGTLAKVFVKRDGGHELQSLRKHINGALKQEFNRLLSETGPLALPAIPATLAWGAMATPFCAMGDLKHKLDKMQEIRVL